MKNNLPGLLIFLGLWSVQPAMDQASHEVTTDKPAVVNGIEYGYAIRNESQKDVGNKGTFNRYEITVYVANKSGCTKLMFPKQTAFGLQNQDLLANFDCLNANGARMTSKSATVRARPFIVPYSTSTKNAEGKTVTTTVQVQAGHMLENGETVSENIIVLVPEGELPIMKVRM
ncbi:ABC transporter permease [Spirosoma sp. KUDC1026]|uniref:ABC transporter permease n=1 Tax=Spirosoma sp. KUDC1026 TaxID=2745947 RepID=UPI001E5E7B7F|nr:ABC transporter permease [Spirosoma sp. KUDC1026]